MDCSKMGSSSSMLISSVWRSATISKRYAIWRSYKCRLSLCEMTRIMSGSSLPKKYSIGILKSLCVPLWLLEISSKTRKHSFIKTLRLTYLQESWMTIRKQSSHKEKAMWWKRWKISWLITSLKWKKRSVLKVQLVRI